jgi:hypothetical protein
MAPFIVSVINLDDCAPSDGQRMLTLFTIPKPFHGHIAVIQQNAIHSWTLLRPVCEIILFGDDEGTAEIARESGVCHVPNVARNEYGTPLVNDLFDKAQCLASHDLLCYVNADIVLMSDFIEAVRQVVRRKRRFLMVGQRWDLDVTEPLDLGKVRWEAQFRSHVAQHGQLHPLFGIDYFVFPKGLWGEIPPFAIGRTVWDNWLIYRARTRGAAVIDATSAVMVVHQNHGYAHVSHGEKGMRGGPEADRNRELAGGLHHVFTVQDATHRLTPKGLRLALSRQDIARHLETIPMLYPGYAPLVRMAEALIALTRPVRLALGITRKS